MKDMIPPSIPYKFSKIYLHSLSKDIIRSFLYNISPINIQKLYKNLLSSIALPSSIKLDNNYKQLKIAINNLKLYKNILKSDNCIGNSPKDPKNYNSKITSQPNLKYHSVLPSKPSSSLTKAKKCKLILCTCSQSKISKIIPELISSEYST